MRWEEFTGTYSLKRVSPTPVVVPSLAVRLECLPATCAVVQVEVLGFGPVREFPRSAVQSSGSARSASLGTQAFSPVLNFVPPAGQEAGGVPSAGDQGQRLQGGGREDQSGAGGGGRDCGSGVAAPAQREGLARRSRRRCCLPGRRPLPSRVQTRPSARRPLVSWWERSAEAIRCRNAVRFGRAAV